MAYYLKGIGWSSMVNLKEQPLEEKQGIAKTLIKNIKWNSKNTQCKKMWKWEETQEKQQPQNNHIWDKQKWITRGYT